MAELLFSKNLLEQFICLLSSANIFFSRRFSSSMAFVWAIIDASMPP
jgi:hypothetical protein